MSRLKRIAESSELKIELTLLPSKLTLLEDQLKNNELIYTITQSATTASRLRKRVIEAANWIKVDWSNIIKGYDKTKNKIVNLVSYYPYDSSETAFVAKDELSGTYYAVPSDYVGSGAGDEALVRSFPDFSSAEGYILKPGSTPIEHREVTNDGHQDGSINDEVWKAYEFGEQQRIFMDQNENSDYEAKSYDEYKNTVKLNQEELNHLIDLKNQGNEALNSNDTQIILQLPSGNEQALKDAQDNIDPEEIKHLKDVVEQTPDQPQEQVQEPAVQEKPKKKTTKKRKPKEKAVKYDIVFNLADETQKENAKKLLDDLVGESVITKWEEMVEV